MLRASLLGVAATIALVQLSVIVACNDVEVTPAPDGGTRPCDPGPFVFAVDESGSYSPGVALSAPPAGGACSADNTNIEVINRLPRGGFYPVGWKVQTQEGGDVSGQSECVVGTICTCQTGVSGPPPAPVDESGADAGAPDASPPPPPDPSGVAWSCYP